MGDGVNVDISSSTIDFRKYERAIILNNWGYYFDYLLSKSDYKEYVVTPDKLKADSSSPQILLYPTIDELIKYHDSIINSNCTIISCQYDHYYNKKIIVPVYNYFHEVYLNFDSELFFEYINLPTLNNYILKKDLDNAFYRFLHVFLNLKVTYNLNPSWLKGVTEKNYKNVLKRTDFVYSYVVDKESFYPMKYSRNATGCFDIDVLTKIAVCELQNKFTPEVRLIIQLLDHNNELNYLDLNYSIFDDEKDKELLDNWDSTIDKLKKEAIIYEPTKGIIKLIM